MEKIITLFAFFFSISTVSSQTLSKKRIQQLKKSVVRVYVDSQASGTGFFVHEDWIVTNRHVVEKGIIRSPINNEVIGILPIKVRLNSLEVIDVEILEDQLISSEDDKSKAYDFVFLKIDSIQKKELNIKIRPLKLGKWEDVREGDIIYTCGYPLSIGQRFTSIGILSEKFTSVEEVVAFQARDKTGASIKDPFGKPVNIVSKHEREGAWADLTVNRGNSGGPVLKLGKFLGQDRVIGITTFLRNPYYSIGEKGAEYYYKKANEANEVNLGPNRQMATLFESLTVNSFGIGGLVSIDYANSILLELNR